MKVYDVRPAYVAAMMGVVRNAQLSAHVVRAAAGGVLYIEGAGYRLGFAMSRDEAVALVEGLAAVLSPKGCEGCG